MPHTTALVTLLAVFLYFYTGILVAKARGKFGVKAPATTGNPDFERVFASGGGPPAAIGRDVEGRLMVPAVTLYALVPGLRSQVADARPRLIEYLVENFHDFVYA